MTNPQKDDIYYHDWVEKLPSLEGRNVAITGTTGNGTGFWVAVCALRKNCATLLLLNRESSRADDSLQRLLIEKAERNSVTQIVPVACDLMSFHSVRSAAKIIDSYCSQSEAKGLHVLINNAGIMMFPDERTVDGYDQQIQTNHLSHFLLTKLLFPSFELALETGSEVRICQHSSGARNVGFGIEEKCFKVCPEGSLGGNNAIACLKRYHQTKLANTLFAMKLHRELQQHGFDITRIKSLVAEPGVAGTDLTANIITAHEANWPSMSAVFKAAKSVAQMGQKYLLPSQSAADGALPLIMAAFGDSSEVFSGDFFYPEKLYYGKPFKAISKGEIVTKGPKHETLTMDQKAQDTLWRVSEDAIGQSFF